MTPSRIKEFSELRISELGLVSNRDLPEIESIQNYRFREAFEIARRIQVLAYLYAITFGVKRKVIKKHLKEFGLWGHLSVQELKLLSKIFLSKQDISNISWFTEAIEILGWTIGLWPNVPETDFCNEDRQADIVPQRVDPSEWIEKSKLIDHSLIHKKADLIYRLHWIAKRQSIGTLGENSNDVYSERHRAINWVLGIEDNWDHVPTDT